MLTMDGWEFLEEYEKLNDPRQKQIILVMLTTSLNPDDETKARNNEIIKGFCHKPLTEEIIEEILEGHFAERL